MTEKVYMVNDTVTFACPVCSQQKIENVSQYVKMETAVELVTTCACGHTWTSALERRRQYRKPVKLRGRYTFRNDVFLDEGLSGGSFVGKGKMMVVDLSLKGLKIELKKKSDLHVKDLLSVEFRLKDKKRTLIREYASVRSINGRFVGSSFGPEVAENSSLGFYLLA
ncbi:MAG: PilZ domain-containing protein [Thermodesulfobacteriota bacterium]